MAKSGVRNRPAFTIFLIALILVLITIAAVMIIGYRYQSNNGIKFVGKSENGQPLYGTLNYPNGEKATFDFINKTITFENGDLYTGDLKGLYRDGKGIMYYAATGDRYEGEFQNDELTGEGIYYYSNNDIYKGRLSKGKMDGYGEITFSSGAKYEGNFVTGKRSGYGIYHWDSGAVYDGAFSEDLKHGYGKMTFSNGDVYEGSFANDRRHGSGTYIWADGDKYTGNFVEGFLDTRITDSEGKFIQDSDGDFLHGTQGHYTFSSGRTYTGFFESGRVVGVELDLNSPTN